MLRLFSLLAVATALVACAGPAGAPGSNGSSCTVVDSGEGVKTLSCQDGTSVVLRDGKAGSACTVASNDDGTKTIACGDGTTVTVRDGEAGLGCTVTDNGDGTRTITCGDGTTVVLHDGEDGEGCTVTDNGDGTKTIACGDGTTVTVRDGEAGVGCTVSDNGDGTRTITCGDGTTVVLHDGEDGKDGEGCTVTDNGDGTKTITCGDGTTVVLRDGVICEPGATRDCYSGPEDTLGVGACVGGTQTCDEDGKRWSACEGEVVPREEVCFDNVDNDCDGEVDEDFDLDGDGFTVCEGDCCDAPGECDDPASVNPGAVEPPVSDNVDQNCNGIADDHVIACDEGLEFDDIDPYAAARALELCETTTEEARTPGVISARWTRLDGVTPPSPVQIGLLSSFASSATPLSGLREVVLSTGAARAMGMVGACGSSTCGSAESVETTPEGFPHYDPECAAGTTNAYDAVVLELRLRVPTNAVGYRFAYRYYSFSYPDDMCSEYEDQFVVLASPAPESAVNGNITLNDDGLPVSTGPFDVCSSCPHGVSDLAGTGFDVWGTAGATGWKETVAQAEGGSTVTLRFALWDAGDHQMDSTVLLDGFQWILDGE